MTTVAICKDDTKRDLYHRRTFIYLRLTILQKCSEGNLQERQDDRVELEEEDATIFGLVNEFLHQGSIAQTASEAEANTAAAMAEYCYLCASLIICRSIHL